MVLDHSFTHRFISTDLNIWHWPSYKRATMIVHINPRMWGRSGKHLRVKLSYSWLQRNSYMCIRSSALLQEASSSNLSSFLLPPDCSGTTWEFLWTSPSGALVDLFLEFRWTRGRVKKWEEQMKKEGNQCAASKRRGEPLVVVGALLPPTETDNWSYLTG